jgi:hypothetical protein
MQMSWKQYEYHAINGSEKVNKFLREADKEALAKLAKENAKQDEATPPAETEDTSWYKRLKMVFGNGQKDAI